MAIFRVALLLFIKPTLAGLIKRSKLLELLPLNLTQNNVVAIALYSDFVLLHRSRLTFIQCKSKARDQHRVSRLQFILRCVVIGIQKYFKIISIRFKIISVIKCAIKIQRKTKRFPFQVRSKYEKSVSYEM